MPRRSKSAISGSRSSRHWSRRSANASTTSPTAATSRPWPQSPPSLSRTFPLRVSVPLGVGQLLVLDSVGLVGGLAQFLAALLHVGLVVALEPAHLPFPFEGEDVRGDAVEEPAVVADHHR